MQMLWPAERVSRGWISEGYSHANGPHDLHISRPGFTLSHLSNAEELDWGEEIQAAVGIARRCELPPAAKLRF